MRIPGPSLASLRQKGDRFATSVRLGVRDTVREATKTVGATTSAEDLLPLRRRWQARVDAELLPTLRQRWLEAASDQRVRLKNAATAVTAAVVPADIPPAAEHLAELYLASARNRLVGIGDQVWWRMRDQLLAGQQAGESVKDLQARLLTTADLEAPRAESIARTEVIGATNRGTMAQMDAAQVTGTKTWVATNDERTRPSHRDADGQSVAMTETFTVGGSSMDGPFDPNAPAEEVINCRCTVTYDIEDDSLTAEQPELPDSLGGSAEVAEDFHLDGLHDQRSHGTPAGFDGDGNPVALAAESLQAEDQTGAMVALVPTDADLDRLVLDGPDAEARGDLHLTLYYLGEAANWPDDRRTALVTALDAMDLMAVAGIGFGAAWWNPNGEEPAWVLNVGEPPEPGDVDPASDLEGTRTRVAEAILLATSGMPDHPVPPQHEPWAPHVCLAYSSEDLVADVAKRVGPLEFDRLRVAFAGEVTDIPLLYPA